MNIICIMLILLCFSLSTGLQSFSANVSPVNLARVSNWTTSISSQGNFEIGIDKSTRCNGHPSCCMRSKVPQPRGFAEIHQQFSAEVFRGKRLKLTAFVKVNQAKEWGGLWMRVNSPDGVVGFDNMADRAISGSNDWKRYSIVLDVPSNATEVRMGCMLTGPGELWVTDFSLEPVAKTVPTTGKPVDPSLFPAEKPNLSPRNLQFEDDNQ